MLCKGQTCGCANLDKASSLIFYIAWKKSKTNKKIREIFLALENLSLYDYAGLKPTIFCHITIKLLFVFGSFVLQLHELAVGEFELYDAILAARLQRIGHNKELCHAIAISNCLACELVE